MTDIRTICSEVDIKLAMINNFKKQRIIDQTAFYLGVGADHYYNPNVDPSTKFSKEDKYYSNITQLLSGILAKKKGARVVIVSLGCGSCEKDRIIMEFLQELGYNIAFFGVDSSMAMIKKANRILGDVTFGVHLICADFGAFNFKRELSEIIGNYDLGIYLFLGNTLGNLNQSYITDVLKNIMCSGDYVLLDVLGFESITSHLKGELFQKHKNYLDIPLEREFFLGPLKAFNIPEDCGELTLDMRTDPVTQAQLSTFGFQVHTPVAFDLFGEETNLSPNEHIDLFHILTYDLNELKRFLGTKKFKLKDQMVGDFANQLLLQK